MNSSFSKNIVVSRLVLLALILCFVVFNSSVLSASGSTAKLDSIHKLILNTDDLDELISLYSQTYKIHKQSRMDSAILYADKMLDVAIEKEDKVLINNSKQSLANLFFEVGNYNRAIEYYFDILAFAQELGDNRELITAYFNIALVYGNIDEDQKAREYYFNALELSDELETKDPSLLKSIPIGRIYNNIGITYFNEQSNDKALEFYHKAIQISKETENEEALQYVYNNIGLVYNDRKDYDIALSFYNRSLERRLLSHDKKGIALTYFYMAKSYMAMEKQDQAIEFYNKAFDITKEVDYIDLQVDIALELLNVFAYKEQFEKSYEMHNIYKTLNDSIKTIQSAKNASMLEMQFEFDKIQKNQEVDKQRSEFRFIFAVGTLVTLLLVTALLYFLVNSKFKRSKLIREKLQLEKSKLEDDLEYKNKELTTNVMYLVKKNELINSISEKLLVLKNGLLKTKQKPFQDIIQELQSGVDNDVWQEFEYRFKEVHEGFYKKLNEQFPDLSPNEKKLCAFLRLNMTTKEISAITFQTPHSITIARSRLRKKLNITNQDINLVDFLLSID